MSDNAFDDLEGADGEATPGYFEIIVAIADMDLAAEREMAAAEYARNNDGVTKTAVMSDVRRIIRSRIDEERARNAPPSDSLAGSLITSGRDETPVYCLANLLLILDSHRDWRGVLWYNAFKDQVEVFGSIPGSGFGGLAPLDAPPSRPITDEDIVQTAAWLNRNYFDNATTSQVWEAVNTVAKANRHHPVRKWLKELEWDGVERLRGLWVDYFGVPPSPYAATVGVKFAISAVARIMKPGSKVDTMPILEGKQGLGKSEGLAVLFGRDYFGDDLPNMQSKDASQYLAGLWCIEKAELEQFKRADWETIKAFISRREERYRKPYGRVTVQEPRQCVFVGTTNSDSYLSDPTGSRRFWPLSAGWVEIEKLEEDRDQLWAEAVFRYQAGEVWWMTPDEEEEANVERDERKPSDPWTGPVVEFVAHAEKKGQPVFIPEILESALELEPNNRHSGTVLRVAHILREIGWTKGKRLKSGKYRDQYPWFSPENDENERKLL